MTAPRTFDDDPLSALERRYQVGAGEDDPLAALERRHAERLAPAMAAADRGDVFTGSGGRAHRMAPIQIDRPAPTAIEAGIARMRNGPTIDDARAGLQATRRSRTLPRPQVDDSNPVAGVAKGFALGALSGPANLVSTYGEGLARTFGLDRAANAIDENRLALDDVAARSPGSTVSTFGAHLLPYLATGRAASGLVKGSPLVKGLAGAAATLPLTGVQSMAGPEGSTIAMLAEMTNNEPLRQLAASTPARVAADIGLDAALGAATEIPGMVRAVRARRAGLAAEPLALDAARETLVQPEFLDDTRRLNRPRTEGAPPRQIGARSIDVLDTAGDDFGVEALPGQRRLPAPPRADAGFARRIGAPAMEGAAPRQLMPGAPEPVPTAGPDVFGPAIPMREPRDLTPTSQGAQLGPGVAQPPVPEPPMLPRRTRVDDVLAEARANGRSLRSAGTPSEQDIDELLAEITPQPQAVDDEAAALARVEAARNTPFPELPPMPQPGPQLPFKDFNAQLGARRAAVRELLGDGSKPVEFIPAGEEGRRSEVFSKDTRTGKYRVTSFGPEGPTGHIEYDSPEEAARWLMSSRPVSGDESQVARWMGGAPDAPPSPGRAVDLFGEPVPDAEPAQAGMFGAKEGTADARSTAQADAAARSRLEQIAAREALETDPAKLQQLAAEKAQLLRQVNRDAKIGADEMATRARAESLGSGLDDTLARATEQREGAKAAKAQLRAEAEAPAAAVPEQDDDVLLGALHRAINDADTDTAQGIVQHFRAKGYTDDEIAEALGTFDDTAPNVARPPDSPAAVPEAPLNAHDFLSEVNDQIGALRRGEQTAPQPQAPQRKPDLTSARYPSGGLRGPRGLDRTDVRALFDEYAERLARLEDDVARSQYDRVPTDAGSPVMRTVGHVNKRGRTSQSEALQRIKQIEGTLAKLDAALQRRGIDPGGAEFAAQLNAAHARRKAAAIDAGGRRPTDAMVEDVERAAMSDEAGSTYTGADPDSGFDLFSNPFMNPALLKRALKDRVVRGFVLSGVGAMTAQSDDEHLAATGRGMIGLGLLHAVGMKNLRALGRKGGGAVVRAIGDTPKGRAVLDFLSRDIMMPPEVKAAVRNYEQGRAYAKARAAELGRKLRQLSPHDNRKVSDLIEREVFEPLPPDDARAVAVLAQEVSDEYTKVGRAKIATGLLSPQTVAEREGRFITRMYAEHLATDPTPPGVKPLGRTTGPRQRAEQRRLDLSDEARNALGEVREASVRAELGLEKSWTNVAAAKLFDDLKALPGVLHPDYVAATDALKLARQSGDRATIANAEALVAAVARDFEQGGADGYVRLTDSAAYGVLRGAVVRKDVADYLTGLPQLGKVLPALMHWWRKAHTVYNLGTHVGNFLSNTGLAHMAGLPLPEQATALPKALQDLRAYGPDTKYLAERGVIGHNVANAGDAQPGPSANLDATLREMMHTTRPETRAILEEKKLTPMGRTERAARTADAKVTRLYAAEDDIFRVALFQKYRAQGMKADVAAELVRNRLVDYRSNSPALGLIRNTVSPFVMYTAKAIPMLLSQIVEHPVRWMTLAAGWGAANEISERIAGPIDEQKDLRPNQRTNRGVGYLLPGNVQLPFRDKSKNASTVNVARFTPLSSLTGSPAPGSLAMAISDDVPGILQPTGPMIDLGARLTNTDPFTGEKLVQPGDDFRDVAGVAAQTAASLALPSAVSFHAPRVAGDIANRDALAAAVDALGFVGARPTVVRKNSQIAREQRELENALYNIGQDLRSELRKTTDPERKRELAERANARRKKAVAKFRERRTTPK